MRKTTRYKIAKSLQTLCAILKISPERVIRRAGLPANYLTHETRGINSQQFFDMWDATVTEAGRPDFPIFLGKTAARGPAFSLVLAFSCSPNIEIGLSRVALFKPLLGPIRVLVDIGPASLSISFESADPDITIPDSLATFELVYLMELTRIFTSEHVVPLAVKIPENGDPDCQSALEEYFGTAPEFAKESALVISLEDAHRPLISENEELWTSYEPSLRRQLQEGDQNETTSSRVKSALLEMLPGGQSSVEAVSDKLRISKRSLQRQLNSEGKSFQNVLDATRSELSAHYLSNDALSVEEISFLLAYRDPNSFYRAFHGWTGMTPMKARGLANASAK